MNSRSLLAKSCSPKSAGFTLVELMVALTLGLLVLGAVTALILSSSSARREVEKTSRQVENGRYAIELLSNDIRLAGFFGELDPTDSLTHKTVPSDPCATPALQDMRFPIQGYDSPTSFPSGTTCGSISVVPGSDILVVRRADSASTASVASGYYYVQATQCILETSDPLRLGTGSSTFDRHKMGSPTSTCSATSAPIRLYHSDIYFVSPFSDTTGDGIPTLKRLERTSSGYQTVALVEGIEYLQVEYGLDDGSNGGTANDGIPDRYVTSVTPATPAASDYTDVANSVSQAWAQVVAIKIFVVSRNNDPTTGYTDPTTSYQVGTASTATYTPDTSVRSYRRNVYSQTVYLENPSSWKGRLK